MNKIKLSIVSILSALSLGAVAFSVPKEPVTVSAYQNNDASTYYNSIDKYDTGDTLTTKLNTLNTAKRRRLIPYNSMPSYFTQTDPGTYSGTVMSFYSGKSARYSGNMNKEHVWPFSRLNTTGERGDTDIEKDMQMIRPTLTSENANRGNSFFVEGMKDDKEGWDPAMETFGDETYRGDSARIIFYCAIADLDLTLSDATREGTYLHSMGKLSDLLRWNLEYPVKNREKTRNEAVESLQGHRNPFIDHPEYACKIWGDYNDETRRICGSQGADGTVTIKHNNIAIEEFDIQVDDSESFTVSYGTSGSRTYNWMFSNIYGVEMLTNVASIVSTNTSTVTIKGDKVGETYLTCKVKTPIPSGGEETVWKAIKINVLPKVDLVSLQLTAFPEKEDYYVGDLFNPKGLKAVATYSDGSSIDVSDRLVYDDVNMDTIGSKKITASYTYKEVTKSFFFYVEVHKREDPEPTPTPTPSGGGGCGGNIATSTILLSSLSITSTLLIFVARKKHKKINNNK